MNRHKPYIRLLLFLCIGTLISTSCETYEVLNKEDTLLSPTTRSFTESDLPVNFFDHSISGIDSVIRTLKSVESETPFIEKFEKKNGIPLWDYTYIIDGGEELLYFVPLYKGKNSKEVKTLWFFHIRDGRMRYAPYKRNSPKMEYDEQRFVFDYLSYCVFGTDNASGFVFVPRKEKPQTRMFITVTRCWDVYTGPSGGTLEYQYTNCITDSYWIDDVKDYTSTPGWSGGGSGDTVLPGGGGGPGTGSGPDAIFKNDTLTSDTWKILNALLEKVKEDCMGEKLYNAIKDKLNGSKMGIRIVDGKDSNYNLDTKILSLNVNDLEGQVYLHEMFHLYQSLQESTPSFINSKMNHEIEATYAQYLFEQKQKEQADENYKNKYGDTKRWYAMSELTNYIDTHGYMRDGMFDMFKVRLIDAIIPAFRSEGYDNYNFNETLTPFPNIKVLTKNCK